MIPFNKPYFTGKEEQYISEVFKSGKTSGNGIFTQRCQDFFEKKYGFKKCLLTTSCTDALEMAAILANIQPGDEVIMPSYTFVSTANAFVLRGAAIIFLDSSKSNPNMDVAKIEEAITPKTKAIVVVHYGGIACDMDEIMRIARQHKLLVIEDAAQALDSYYKGNPLGSIGHLSCFSFHETKNIISGEGGMLVINDEQFIARAEIIWEKGTNRAAFWRGEVDKYNWVDIGSSFLPSDILAAILFAQVEQMEEIQRKRKDIWNQYYSALKSLLDKKKVRLPEIPDYATNNAHLFYLVCNSLNERSALIEFLKGKGIHAVFHYISLHDSPFYAGRGKRIKLSNCSLYSDCLVRLPLFYELTEKDVNMITAAVNQFFN